MAPRLDGFSMHSVQGRRYHRYAHTYGAKMQQTDCDDAATPSRSKPKPSGPTATPAARDRRKPGGGPARVGDLREPVVGHDAKAGENSNGGHRLVAGHHPVPPVDRAGDHAQLGRQGVDGPEPPDFGLSPLLPSHGDSVALGARLNKPDGKLSVRPAHPCQLNAGVLKGAMAKQPDPTAPPDDEAARRAEVGERLRKVRMLIDVNRSRLAREFTIDGKPVFHTTWRMWELGKFLPNINVMIEFCDRFHVTLDWIYRGRFETLPKQLQLIMYRAYPELLEQQIEADPDDQGEAAPAPKPIPAPLPAQASVPNIIRMFAQGPARGRSKRGSLPRKRANNGAH